jgi:predicted GNAT family acetyltransferase
VESRVIDNSDAGRYELRVDTNLVGWIDYRRAGDTVALVHAEVREERRGQGLAEEMTRDALADLKRRALKAEPLCPYVVAYARRHPDEV